MKLDKKRGCFKVYSMQRKMPAEAADYQAVAGDV